MKPPKENCKHCDLVDDCKRTQCNRKAIFTAYGTIKMCEPKEYDMVRKPEQVRAYREIIKIKYNF